MGYYTGTSALSSPQSQSTDIPTTGTPIGTPGPTLSGAAANANPNIAPGSISAPSPVLQNINNFSGSTGSLMGNFNQGQGLQNYNQMAGQYGQYGGQWTPWGLSDKASGGYGDPSQQYNNYFVGNQGMNNIQAGRNFSAGGGAYQDLYRNAYTGTVDHTGANHLTDLSSLYGLKNQFGQDQSLIFGGFDPNYSTWNTDKRESYLDQRLNAYKNFDPSSYVNNAGAQFLKDNGYGSGFDTGANADQLMNYAKTIGQGQWNAYSGQKQYDLVQQAHAAAQGQRPQFNIPQREPIPVMQSHRPDVMNYGAY